MNSMYNTTCPGEDLSPSSGKTCSITSISTGASFMSYLHDMARAEACVFVWPNVSSRKPLLTLPRKFRVYEYGLQFYIFYYS